MSLIRELKRRHVFRMALLYLVSTGLRGLQRGAGGACPGADDGPVRAETALGARNH